VEKQEREEHDADGRREKAEDGEDPARDAARPQPRVERRRIALCGGAHGHPARRGPATRLLRNPAITRVRHSYTSRNRRSTKMLMMLIASVTAKSTSPTAKIVRYSTVPCGSSPMLVCAIYAVMVCTPRSGLRVSAGWAHAAMVTIIV